MPVTIYSVDVTDSPNTGRIKFNSSISNLKTAVDDNTAARTGIGPLVGTTAIQTLLSKVLISVSAGGTNTITIARQDISGTLFKFTTDDGSANLVVNGGSVSDVQILGGNGIETSISASKIYIKCAEAMVLNEAAQTLTLGAAAVTVGYAVDITGNQRLYGKLAIGDWSTVPTDILHIKGDDNATPIGAAIQNLGTGGAILKLMETSATDYWYFKYAAGAGNELEIGFKNSTAITIDSDVSDETLHIATNKKIGIGTSTPAYSLQVGAGIGINSDQISFDTGTQTVLLHTGSGNTRFQKSGIIILDINATNRHVGIKGAADATYALKVHGEGLFSGDILGNAGLILDGKAYLNQGITVDTNKFLVTAAGNVTIAGTATIVGTSTMGNIASSGNITMVTSKTLTTDIIAKTHVSDYLVIKASDGTGIGYFTESGQLHVGDALLATNKVFAVKGLSRFIAASTTNYFDLSSTGTGNYLDTADTGSGQKSLYFRVAGTGLVSNSIFFKTGIASNVDSLETRLAIDGVNKRIVINNDSGHDHFIVYSPDSTTMFRPISMYLGGSTHLSWNAHYSGGVWRCITENSAASIGLSNDYLTISVLKDGMAGAVISWETAIRIGTDGLVAIGGWPEAGHALVVGGSLKCSSLTSNNAVQAANITAQAVVVNNTTDSLSIQTTGGITARTRVEVLTTDEIAFKAQNYNTAFPTPKVYLGIDGGSNITMFGSLDSSNKKRAEILVSSTDGYLYSKYIKAGECLYAGYTPQVDNGLVPVWCPVQFTAYATSNAAHDLFLSGTYTKTTRIPKTGLYKITFVLRSSWASGSNDKTIDVSAKILSSSPLYNIEIASWSYKTNSTLGLIEITVCGMAHLQASLGSASLKIYLDASSSSLNSALIKAVHLEYIHSEATFNAGS